MLDVCSSPTAHIYVLISDKIEKSDSSPRKRKVWCLAKASNKVRLYQNWRTEPQGYSHRCKTMRNEQCLQEITGKIYINHKYIPYRVKVSWIHELMLKGELKHMEEKEFELKELSVR